MSSSRIGQVAYFDMLHAGSPPGALIETRWRLPDGQKGMGQCFHPADRPESLIEMIEGLGRRTDVYVGVGPRSHRRGTRDVVQPLHAAWVDCDTSESIERLARFRVRPSMIVRSGSGVHAYFALAAPIPKGEAEPLNRRIAHVLKADRKSTDAARVLRPPGTWNHKTGTPQPVYVVNLNYDALYVPTDLERHAPPLPVPVGRTTRPVDPSERTADDPLLAIPTAEYVEALTGRTPDSGGYCTCPFHAAGAERTPSFRLYDNGSWTCFGSCEPEPDRDHFGGDVYTFAARLWGLSTRNDFPELRRLLLAVLLGKAAAA